MTEQPAAPAPRRIGFISTAGGLLLALALGGYYFAVRTTTVPNVTFISLSGEKITTQSLRGKVVMVHFWSTSCTTCLHEMPEMIATYQQYHSQGLELIAVAMRYDAPNYVLDYTKTRQLPFTVALDSGGNLAQALGDVQATPTTLVIDKNGKIIQRYVGEPSFPQLHQLLENALKS